jgi:hypothetical protein
VGTSFAFAHGVVAARFKGLESGAGRPELKYRAAMADRFD